PVLRGRRVRVGLSMKDRVKRMILGRYTAVFRLAVELQRKRRDRLGDQPCARPRRGQTEDRVLVDLLARPIAATRRERRPEIGIEQPDRNPEPLQDGRPDPPGPLRLHAMIGETSMSSRSSPSSASNARPMAMISATGPSIFSSSDSLRG